MIISIPLINLSRFLFLNTKCKILQKLKILIILTLKITLVFEEPCNQILIFFHFYPAA